MAETEKVSALRKLNLVFRFSYTIPFFLASVCGVTFAYLYGDVPLYIAILIPLTVLFMALFVNFSNDYFDSVSGADDLRFQGVRDSDEEGVLDTSPIMKKIYWDGNPVNNGMVTVKQAQGIMVFLVAVCLLLAIPIFLFGGWIIVIFGGIGLLIAFFYTAPPVNLGARGLGEIAVAVSFFLMVFASYYVAVGEIWSNEVFVFSMAIGTMVGLMRIVDSMSGQEAHIAAGEKSISVIVGLDRMHIVIKSVLVVAYIFVAMMAYFDVTYLLLFLTLPVALKGCQVLKEKKKYWECHVAPLMFLIALMTELIFLLIMVIQVYYTNDFFATLF